MFFIVNSHCNRELWTRGECACVDKSSANGSIGLANGICMCVCVCVCGSKIKMCPKDGGGREKAKSSKKGTSSVERMDKR